MSNTENSVNGEVMPNRTELRSRLAQLCYEHERRDWVCHDRSEPAVASMSADERLAWADIPFEEACSIEPVTVVDFAALILLAYEPSECDVLSEKLKRHAKRIVIDALGTSTVEGRAL